MSDEVGIEFGGSGVVPDAVRRRRMDTIRQLAQEGLVQAAPNAVKFVVGLIDEAMVSDDPRMKKLGLVAAQDVLDRSLGKAAQEVRVSDERSRPVVFDSKLEALRTQVIPAVAAAVMAQSRGGDAVDAFGEALEERAHDYGVTI